MDIVFSNEINNWYESSIKRTTPGINEILKPNNRQIFFESKLEDIVRQYAAARTFLLETNTPDWKHWFEERSGNDEMNSRMKTIMGSMFLESAIIYYNIVVDLTWVMTYVCAEYSISDIKSNILIEDIYNIDKINDILRKLENYVKNPNHPENPLSYIKKNSYNFLPAINSIEEFWRSYSNDEMRNLYNHIKHKGKPVYKEIFESVPKKFGSIIINGEEHANDKSDVKYEISFNETIKKLIEFDNEKLFPYCDKLFDTIMQLIY